MAIKIKMMLKLIFVSLLNLVSSNSKTKVEKSSTFTPSRFNKKKKRISMGLILDQRRNYSTKMPLDVKILDHW
jgi:hypothetical protein